MPGQYLGIFCYFADVQSFETAKALAGADLITSMVEQEEASELEELKVINAALQDPKVRSVTFPGWRYRGHYNLPFGPF